MKENKGNNSPWYCRPYQTIQQNGDLKTLLLGVAIEKKPTLQQMQSRACWGLSPHLCLSNSYR